MSARHGSAVARNGRGVLILGESGAGKSCLVLELLAIGADLVADDAVIVQKSGPELVLGCPPNIAGMIEAHGVGLLSVNSIDQARLAFVVDLDKTANARLPPPETVSILGVDVPLIRGKNTPALSAVIWMILGDGQLLPVE